jgi:hypothetical protein
MTLSPTSLEILTSALNDLSIPYLIGGSIASSYHGTPRATMDIDVLAAIRPQHVPRLVEELGREFIAFEDEIVEALRSGRPFNLIHRASGEKFNVFAPTNAFHWSDLERALLARVPFMGRTTEVRIASAEDITIAKLIWFREGGEVSERQWSDIVGLLRRELDSDYLNHWAEAMGVMPLLQLAIRELST